MWCVVLMSNVSERNNEAGEYINGSGCLLIEICAIFFPSSGIDTKEYLYIYIHLLSVGINLNIY